MSGWEELPDCSSLRPFRWASTQVDVEHTWVYLQSGDKLTSCERLPAAGGPECSPRAPSCCAWKHDKHFTFRTDTSGFSVWSHHGGPRTAASVIHKYKTCQQINIRLLGGAGPAEPQLLRPWSWTCPPAGRGSTPGADGSVLAVLLPPCAAIGASVAARTEPRPGFVMTVSR